MGTKKRLARSLLRTRRFPEGEPTFDCLKGPLHHCSSTVAQMAAESTFRPRSSPLAAQSRTHSQDALGDAPPALAPASCPLGPPRCSTLLPALPCSARSTHSRFRSSVPPGALPLIPRCVCGQCAPCSADCTSGTETRSGPAPPHWAPTPALSGTQPWGQRGAAESGPCTVYGAEASRRARPCSAMGARPSRADARPRPRGTRCARRTAAAGRASSPQRGGARAAAECPQEGAPPAAKHRGRAPRRRAPTPRRRAPPRPTPGAAAAQPDGAAPGRPARRGGHFAARCGVLRAAAAAAGGRQRDWPARGAGGGARARARACYEGEGVSAALPRRDARRVERERAAARGVCGVRAADARAAGRGAVRDARARQGRAGLHVGVARACARRTDRERRAARRVGAWRARAARELRDCYGRPGGEGVHVAHATLLPAHAGVVEREGGAACRVIRPAGGGARRVSSCARPRRGAASAERRAQGGGGGYLHCGLPQWGNLSMGDESDPPKRWRHTRTKRRQLSCWDSPPIAGTMRSRGWCRRTGSS
jgi:hypothetical protein